jgi:two-component system sensor histidine kinase KdpD
VLGRLRPLTAPFDVVLDVPDDLPPVLLDYVQIDQVLSNLIENATKYTPAGAEIHISVDRSNDELRIRVADRGPGLPVSALGRVFDPFFRVDGNGRADAARPRPAGTGLGLAVARGLVEAHGGRIWAENRPGGGACFIIALPASESVESPSPVAQGVA